MHPVTELGRAYLNPAKLVLRLGSLLFSCALAAFWNTPFCMRDLQGLMRDLNTHSRKSETVTAYDIHRLTPRTIERVNYTHNKLSSVSC
jgi:hypothetical protein